MTLWKRVVGQVSGGRWVVGGYLGDGVLGPSWGPTRRPWDWSRCTTRFRSRHHAKDRTQGRLTLPVGTLVLVNLSLRSWVDRYW